MIGEALPQFNWKTAGWKINLYTGKMVNGSSDWMESIHIEYNKSTGQYSAKYYHYGQYHFKTGDDCTVGGFIDDSPKWSDVREYYEVETADELVDAVNRQVRKLSESKKSKAANTRAANEARIISEMDAYLLICGSLGEDNTAQNYIWELQQLDNEFDRTITPMKVALRASAWAKANNLPLKQATFSKYPTYFYPECLLDAAIETIKDEMSVYA